MNDSTLPEVILLNGTCSSGKTSIARELQQLFDYQFLNLSIDSILYSLPPSDLKKMMKGEKICRKGFDYKSLVAAYHNSIKAVLDAGCRLIADNAWTSKDEVLDLERKLEGYDTVRVGVKCDLEICRIREKERGDRAEGLAVYEYPLVHKVMNYDIVVDTTRKSPHDAAVGILNELPVVKKSSRENICIKN